MWDSGEESAAEDRPEEDPADEADAGATDEDPPDEDPADEADAGATDEDPPDEDPADEDVAATGQAGPGAGDAERPERAAHKSSDVDAMGQDKRRQVVGHTYAPTRARIAVRFVIFFAVVALLLFGAKIAVDRLDQPPDTVSREAPWAQPDAEQRPPRPLQ